ncbi:hypothetical protein HPB48_007265 [Haemaphysalis longicornis]|uniref:Seven cysteines N-terminal domain-containing protein n=1 Tax=Haemaphysalis longicornis TaxID=44386 RepID=A0A9J6GND3_HAELO|nr:hypothetical protein HPB48_007265 [Haemaphysalis longicornis]
MGRALYTVAGFAFATFLTLPIVSGQEGFTARPTAAAAKPPLTCRGCSLTGPGSSSRDVLDNFQVNENRIIRTEDSRRMGARYLNETELSSNRDLPALGKGSCYLFDCGPPSHFLCLFTAHAYYTVSVLTVPSRNTAEAPANSHSCVSPARRQTPDHLLRDPSAVTQAPRPAPTTSSPHQANRGQAETDQDEQTDSRHCQHYQFRCQNSSECIAVYNVCDGIPQCQDGSDEAEDLKCPGAKIVEASSVVANPPTTTLPTTADHAKPGSTTVVASEQQNRVPVINSPQPSLTDDSPRHNPMADIGRMPRPGLGGSHGGFPALSHSSRLRWGDDAGSHNRPRPEYRDPYEEPFLGGGGEQAKYYDYGQSYPESSRYWINDPDAQLYPMVADDTFYQPVVEVAPPPAPHQGSSKHLSKHLQKPNAKPAKAAATSAASNHHNERPVQFSRLHEVANMQVSFTQVEQGGRGAEQESGSAVLALTLGLCITGLLLVLVGCRLRLARHRLARRGGRSALAHDADYLVNGMYL